MEKIKEKIGQISENETYRNLGRIFGLFFLVFLFVYVICQTLLSTTFPTDFLLGIAGILYQILLWLVVLKTGCGLQNGKKVIAALGIALCYGLAYRELGFSFLSFYALIIVGCVGVEYRKILKGQVLVVGTVFLSAVAAAFAGVTENLVYLEAGKLRDSFGILYPTDFASYLFYLLLFFWMAWGELPHWVSLILCTLFLCIAHFYALSDTCTICGGLFFCILLAFLWMEKRIKPEQAQRSVQKGVNRLTDGILILAFPICACFLFSLMGLYAADTGLGRRLNAMLTGRLHLAYQALAENGIHIFGSPIPQVGAGATTFPVSGYNFIDSTYALIPIRYGILLFAVIALYWVFMTFWAVKRRDYRLAFGMGLIAFHSLAEHHFMDINYNILLLLPLADFTPPAKKTAAESGEETRHRIFGGDGFLTAFLFIAVALLTEPVWMAYLRTVCGWLRRTHPSLEYLAVAGSVVVFLFLLALLILACREWSRKKSSSKLFAVAAVVLLWGGAVFAGGLLTQKAEQECGALADADAAALRIILESAQGKVCVDELPVLYRRRFSQISYPVLMGEDLARYPDRTVVVPRSKEYICFLRRGFQYAAISEESAVYTNDEAVIGALLQNGYQPKDYYDETRRIELPLWNAPTVDLRAGDYTVRYVFEAEGTEEGREFAKIQIVGNYGRTILLDQSIRDEALSEENCVEIEISLQLPKDTGGVKFYLLPENGASVEAKEISYRMDRLIQEP